MKIMRHFCSVLFLCAIAAISSNAAEFYVDASRPDDSGDGQSWETAKQTIQAAVDAAAGGDTIHVAAGTYDSGATVTPGYSLSNRVYIAKAIVLQAVDGPDQTFIVGAAATGGGMGSDAVRCMFVANVNAFITGFTFSNGRTAGSGNYHDSGGGGVCAEDMSPVVLSNCVFTSNQAWYGGGFCGKGTTYNCTFSNNSASSDGGGAYGNLIAYDCEFIGNSAFYGGGAAEGSQFRCTFSGNHAGNGGGGLKGGIARDCVFINNSAYYGGGKYYGQAYDSVFSGNSGDHGGGAYDGIFQNCVFSNNTASVSGGGVSNGNATDCLFIDNHCNQYGGGLAISPGTAHTATRCTFVGNYGYNGGGIYGGTATACLFLQNTAGNGGGTYGTTANNSVLAGNIASYAGGGMYGGTANNCTITGNSADSYGGGCQSGTPNNCIVWYNTAAEGGNNLNDVSSPRFTCSPEVAHGVDGCITNEPAMASNSHLTMSSPCIGAGSASYLSGSDIDGEPWAATPAMGCDQPDATANGNLVLAIAELPTKLLVGSGIEVQASIVGQCDRFTLDLDDGAVWTNRLDAISHRWNTSGTKHLVLTAFNEDFPQGKTIEGTVLVATLEEATIHVAPDGNDANDGSSWTDAKATIQAGVDAQEFPGGVVLVADGTYLLSDQIQVDKPISIRSMNGPEHTIVDGNGNSRCFHLGEVSCSIEGFTITNGYEEYSNGGGIYCYEYDQIVSNCVIVGNMGNGGGGMYYGTAIHCTFIGNSSPDSYGGGMYGGRAHNCLFANNSGYYGGGAYDVELNHCTIVDNSAKYEGGGTCYGYMTNCIVWNNVSTNYPDDYPNVYDTYGMFNCSPAVVHGENGCITNAPLFAGTADYRLRAGSPCIDAGTNGVATVATDLDGRPRIVGAAIDMGAYEFSGPADSDGDLIPDDWEALYFGGATNAVPSASAANGINTVWECYVADLDPTAATAEFAIGSFASNMVSFASSSNRRYSLLWCTNLVDAAWIPIVGPRDGTGTDDSMMITNALDNGFFRLHVELP